MKGVDLKGKVFGRLTVLKDVGREKHSGCVLWQCQCECGQTTTVDSAHLRNGHTKSCGCLLQEWGKSGKAHYRHGHSSPSPTYQSWSHMKTRCSNPTQDNYYRYGEIGITVCKRWLKFENFLEDMGERPEGTTLGRYKDKGNYKQTNCSWQTPEEQGANKKAA
jgi:hypothetical protein